MPSRAMRFCAHTGCDQLVERGYCPAHQALRTAKATEYDRARPSAAEQGYDAAWARLRAIYLAKHPTCEECAAHGELKVAVMVHHIVPIKDGGARLDQKNLRALCNDCHERIHGKDRWKRRPPGGS